MHTCLYLAIYQQIQAYSGSYRLKSGSSNQVLLLNHCYNLFRIFFHFCFRSKHSTFFSSGQYFSNSNNNNNSMSHMIARQITIEIYLEYFFNFVTKVNSQHFFSSGQYFNNFNNSNKSMPSMQKCYPCHPRYTH